MSKKIVAVVLGVALSVAGFCSTASAVDFKDAWMGCTPLVIGPASGRVTVQLSCTDAAGTAYSGWAMMSTTSTDQMMAVMLTAMSLTNNVAVQFSGTDADAGGFVYSQIVGLQLSNL